MALELGEYDIGIDRRLSDPGAIAAIAAGNDVFAPHQLGITANALRNQFRMLDEIRFRFDDAGDQHLAVRQFHLFEQRPLVRMPRIGGLERDRNRLCHEYDVDDVRKRNVAMVRAFIVAPAEMHA